MDIDDASTRASQIRKHRLFKGGIPVQNPVPRGILCTETGILMGIAGLEPLWTVAWVGTVNDVGDAALVGELRGQMRPGTHENAGVEVGGRLPKVVWNGGQH
jgi:hypothetical protein